MKELIKEIVLLSIVVLFGYYIFNIPTLLLFIILILGCSLVTFRYHKIEELHLKLENYELLDKITINSSDNKLKRKQLIAMISCLSTPLVLINKKGEIAIYNKAFERFKGKYENNNKVHPEVEKIFVEAFILEKSIEKNIIVDDVEFETNVSPIKIDDKYQGSVLIFQDMTKIKEKEKLQKEFIANASHEIKTPITSIKGMVEILNRDDFDDDNIRKDFLIQIEKETNRLEDLANSLMNLSSYDNGVIILNRQNVDFTKIVDDCISTFKAKAKEKNIKIIKNYQIHSEVFVDYEKMTIVIGNLINNAIKYSDSDCIELNYYMDSNRQVIFEIKDYGKGIAEKDINNIFDRFYRVDKARSRKEGGSGLGLSIVKEICDSHNIKIIVESELNKGTIFKLYFSC